MGYSRQESLPSPAPPADQGRSAGPLAIVTDNQPGNHEDPDRSALRRRSIIIAHIAMAIFSLGFSIVITGVLPYMKRLLPSLEKSEPDRLTFLYGVAVSMNPFAQAVSAPLAGVVSNKLGSIRAVCICTCVVFILGNVLYSLLSVFPEEYRLGLLLLSRVLTGISSANNANLRSYLASCTYEHERTTQMSYSSAMQSIGFLIGPAVQALIVPLECQAVPDLSKPYLTLDMFTLTGWISAGLGLICLILFLPGIFVEVDVNAEEQAHQAASNVTRPPLPKPDYLALFACILAFFFYLFNFIIVETLGTPLSMDEFGWKESTAMTWMGILMSIGGALSFIGFGSVGKLSKRFDERWLMILLGIIPMFLSRMLMLPFPWVPHAITPKDKNITLLPTEFVEYTTVNEDDDIVYQIFKFLPNMFGRSGPVSHLSSPDSPILVEQRVPCDEDHISYCAYDWCETTPGILQWQFDLGMLGTFACYPFCLAIVQSVFSKVLGPRPQGLWMGVLTGAGSFARFLGPIFVTYVYSHYGPYMAIGLVAGSMVLTLLLVIGAFQRLIPLGVRVRQSSASGEG